MLPEKLKDRPVAAALEAWNPSVITGGTWRLNELMLQIDAASIVEVCRYLKEEQQFNRVAGITGLDWYPMEPRFEVVYLLHSVPRNERVRLKCKVSGENPAIDSVCSVWSGANWYERETFDLFGIRFHNHPDLTRIMMPEDWDGHPLRKDYPVHGHKYDYKDQ
jgi:NADH-quinone oxidoreductase subunit C